jgi:NAD(P)-dependent dehydrogenase (short-subunit alcohol dehydrogenase family)
MEVDLGLDRYPAIVTEASRCWGLGVAETLVLENAIAPGAFETNVQPVAREPHGILAKCRRRITAAYAFKAGEADLLACFLPSPISHFIAGSTSVIDAREFSRL